MQNLSSWGARIGMPPQEACPAFTEGNSPMLQQHRFQLELRKDFQAGLRDGQDFKKRQSFFLGRQG